MHAAVIAGLCIVLTSCSHHAPKGAVEREAGRMVGRKPSVAFGDKRPPVVCETRNGEYGCLLVDRRGCRLWFGVDRDADRVTNWRYDGEPEKCWTYSHGG